MPTIAPTKDEQLWMDLITDFGCIVCHHFFNAPETPAEVHHMLNEYNERLGHLYTLSLCWGHHRGCEKGKVPRHSPKRNFENAYGTEMTLLRLLRYTIFRDQNKILPQGRVHFTLPSLPALEGTKIIPHQGCGSLLR